MEFELPLPVKGKIDFIFHLSDIHIRKGDYTTARISEYDNVFSRIIKYIDKNPHKTSSCIVITGDVFDNKDVVNMCGWNLLYNFIHQLSLCAPVYIIKGNHDYRQERPDIPDMLSFLKIVPLNNVTYLDEVGFYYAGDIGFALMPIHFTLNAGCAVGRSDVMPEFPSALNMRKGLRKRIALFHGTVPSDRLSIDWFGDGYDFILLGDLHIQGPVGMRVCTRIQDIHGYNDIFSLAKVPKSGNAPLAMYPGSTVQQTFGEDLLGHGILLWSLKDDLVDMLHVKNDCAKIYAVLQNEIWHFLISSCGNKAQTISIDDCAQLPWFPSKLEVIVKSKCPIDHIYALESHLKSTFDISCRVCTLDTLSVYSQDTHEENDKTDLNEVHVLETLNTPAQWISYLEQQLVINNKNVPWSDWKTCIKDQNAFLFNSYPDGVIGKDICEAIKKRNIKIQDCIDKYRECATNLVNRRSRKMKLITMNWDWMLCYRQDCVFDFGLLNGKVACISASNGHGKTSCKEIIHIALFGEGFPGRDPKTMLICQQKPEKAVAKTQIVFMIDDNTYRLTRIFKKPDERGAKSTKNVIIEKLCTQDNTFAKINEGPKAVKDWIAANIGDNADWLASCMLTQNCDGDFFALTPKLQVEKIDQVLNLQTSCAFRSLIKESVLGYKQVVDKLTSLHAIIEDDECFVFDIEAYENKKLERVQLEQQSTTLSTDIEQLGTYLSKSNMVLLSKGKDNLECLLEEKYKELEKLNQIITLPCIQDLFAQKSRLEAELEHNSKYDPIPFNTYQLCLETLGEHPVESIDIINHELVKLKDKQSKINYQFTSEKDLADAILKNNNQFDFCIKEINQISQALLETEALLNETKIQYNEVLNARPMQPRDSYKDYLIWKKALTSYEEQWEQISNLEKKVSGFAFGNGIDIAQKLQAIKDWSKSIEDITKITDVHANDDKIQQFNSLLERVKTSYSKKLETYTNLNTQVEQDLKQFEISQEMVKHTKQMKLTHLEKRPESIPKYWKKADEKECEHAKYLQSKKDVCLLNTYNTDADKWIIINGQKLAIDFQIKHEIEQIRNSCKQHSYNPDCAACQSHPQRLENIQLDNDINQLTFDIKSISKQMMDGYGKIFDSNDICLAKKRLDVYDSNLFWEQYFEQEKSYKEWVELKEYIDKDEKHVQLELDNTKTSYDTSILQLKKLKTDLDKWETRLSKFLDIEKELIIKNAEHIALENWNAYSVWTQLIDKTDYWTRELTCIEEFDKWQKQERDLKAILDGYISTIELFNEQIMALKKKQDQTVLKLSELKDAMEIKRTLTKLKSMKVVRAYKKQKELNSCNDAITLLEDKCNIEKEIQDIKDALTNTSLYDKLVNTKLEMSSIGTRCSDILIIIGRLENNYQKHIKLKERVACLQGIIQELFDKCHTLDLMDTYFADFKRWLIQEKAIPILCKYVNQLLVVMCKNHRTIQLTSCFASDGTLSWMLQDGLNCLSLFKASGYQRFAVALAMRITLNKLGGSGIISKQLFIDEGFTACDSANLASVPEFLDGLLSSYDSVLIVTHLQELKDCINKTILIERDNFKSLSYLHFAKMT
jgi:DNA repair exonuclease SbcCD ATPase subunit